MITKIVAAYCKLTDEYSPAISILLITFMVIIGIAIGFTITLGVAWLLMTVYNAIAAGFNWPTFSIWVWVGLIYAIAFIKKIGFKKSAA